MTSTVSDYLEVCTSEKGVGVGVSSLRETLSSARYVSPEFFCHGSNLQYAKYQKWHCFPSGQRRYLDSFLTAISAWAARTLSSTSRCACCTSSDLAKGLNSGDICNRYREKQSCFPSSGR